LKIEAIWKKLEKKRNDVYFLQKGEIDDTSLSIFKIVIVYVSYNKIVLRNVNKYVLLIMKTRD